MIRAIIIGTGQIGRIHADSMMKSSKIQLLGFIGNNFSKTKTIAWEYGVEAFKDLDSLGDRTVDMAIVATPSYIRKELICKLIDKKINILCEKPFSLSLEEGLSMADYAENKDIKLMVGHVVRFWPAYAAIREIMAKGSLGQIVHIYANRLSRHPDWTTWHRDPLKSGGGLYDLAIHDLDYLVSLLGQVRSLDSIGRKNQDGCYNHTITNLSFQNSSLASLESNMDVKGDYPFTTSLRISASKGSLEYESGKKLNKKGQLESYEALIEYIEGQEARRIKIDKYDPYLKQMEYLADAIEKDRKIEIIRMDQVLHVLKILEGIKRSIEEDRSIDLV